ncbi:MAG: hypothetical protein HOI95_00760 [Chromatiales bacterium]|nr:hypothetical protein [Chromatiales bacterium]
MHLTRGKPSAAQLSLADELDSILAGNYLCQDGTDAHTARKCVRACKEI